MLKYGATGAAVGELHQRLIEAGAAIDHGELDAESYGASTAAAVCAFQQQHGLDADGIAGPRTMAALAGAPSAGDGCIDLGWRCEPSQARPQLVEVLRAAVGEIGVRESPAGSNRGPRVDVFTAPQLGIPWCAAFASWCYARAEGGSPFGRRLSALCIYEWARGAGAVLGDEEPLLPGDVALILRADGHGHVALIAGVAPDGTISTVEGNSADAVRGRVCQRARFRAVVRPVR